MELKKPLISVIVPHLNQPEALDICLRSLHGQNLERTLFEVIVVDNGSTIPPANVVSRHPGTRLLLELQPGPGPARNAGVRNALADVIAFTDADCRAHPAWLQSALEALQTSPKGTILGGDVRIWRVDPNGFAAIEAYESVFGFRNKMYIERQGYSVTANLVGRRSDIEAVDPFSGIQFAEDIEWGERARRAGFQFRYVGGMIIFHPARRSLLELYAKWDRQMQHYFNMVQGEPAWKTRWIVHAFAILASPVLDVGKVLRSNRIKGAPARIKAILVLFVIRAHRTRRMLSLLRASKPVVWNRDTTI
jgi:glycosyltransferase involved in cell wall biosynthesis